MIAFLIRRVSWALVVVLMAVSVVFLLQFGFGDIAVSLGPNASPERRQTFRERNGVDRPWVALPGVAELSDPVRNRIAQGHSRLVQCFRESVQRGQKRGGTLSVDLRIEGGVASDITFTDGSLGDDETKACIRSEILGLEAEAEPWRFAGVDSESSSFAIQGDTFGLFHQYLSYIGVADCLRPDARAVPGADGPCGLLQGDLGVSFSHDDSVMTTIGHRLPRTLLLGVMTLSLELMIGLFIGILAATKRNTWLDTTFMGMAFLGISLPTFVSGLLFLFFFAFLLGWFPVGGYGTTPWEHIQHGFLPAFTLAIVGAATYARIMRSEMIETLGQDYIRTARAKGLGKVRTVVVHGVRNAMLPVVTMMGLSLRIVVSGAIITEQIFAWPGVGALAVESIVNQDAFTVMGIVLIIALTVQLGNILADIAVASLDPRVRIEGGGSK